MAYLGGGRGGFMKKGRVTRGKQKANMVKVHGMFEWVRKGRVGGYEWGHMCIEMSLLNLMYAK